MWEFKNLSDSIMFLFFQFSKKNSDDWWQWIIAENFNTVLLIIKRTEQYVQFLYVKCKLKAEL